MDPTSQLPQRIQTLRKAMHRSIHDCATVLRVTPKRYLQFEQGADSLSLPEIEILARYLGISLKDLFSSEARDFQDRALLEEDLTGRYQALRTKMIRTRLAHAREAAGVSLEDLHETTQIPLDVLRSFEMGTVPIPITALQQLSAALELPLTTFFPPQDGEPLFSAPNPPPDLASQLLTALRKLPEKDQAQVAKILLNKLAAM